MSVPILTQLKKVARKNKAYAAQKIAELAETTVAALTELQENTQPAPRPIRIITISRQPA